MEVLFKYLQSKHQANHAFISWLIPITITAVNFILSAVMFLLLKIEFSHSYSDERVSRYNRVVFGSVLNTVFLPLVLTLITGGDIVGEKGLSNQMLKFSITNATVPFIISFFDPFHFTKRLVLSITPLRNQRIKALI